MKARWAELPLGEVAEVVNGGTPKSKVEAYWNGGVAWLTPKDMGQLSSRYVAKTGRTISGDGLANSSAKLVPAGSLILSTRAPIGHLALNEIPMAFNQGCRGLLPSDRLDVRFLFYFLSANVDMLNDLGSGTTFKELSASALKGVPIPLPPIEEQRRIVAVLDEAFEGLARARANIEANVADAEGLFTRSLSDGLDRLLNDGVPDVPLGDMAEIARGGSPRPIKQFLTDAPDGVNWIKIGDTELGGRYIDGTAERIKPEGRSRSRSVEAGDFLLTNSMSFGRPYILRTDGCIHDGWLLIRPDYDRVDQDYLYFALLADRTFSQFDALAAGTTVRNLNKERAARASIPVPTIDAQRAFVRSVEGIRERTSRMGEAYEGQHAASDDLQTSLLSRAFAGELT